MNYSIKQYLFFFFTILFVSFNSHSQYEHTTLLRTSPSQAKVFIGKNAIGTTPLELSKLKMDDTLRIESEGYETVFLLFFENKRGNSFPATLEESNSFIMSYDKREDFYDIPSGTIIMRKKLPEYDSKIMVAIDTPRLDLPEKYEFGRINGSKTLFKGDDFYRYLGYPQNMEVQLINSSHDTYLDAMFYTNNTKDEATLYLPKVILKPVIKKLNFNLKGKLLRDYKGPCVMECEWLVSDLSQPSKVLAKFPISTQIYRTGNNYELILHQLIFESKRDLLANDTLFDFLNKLEKNYLNRSKISQPLSLMPSKPLVYSSTKEMLRDVIAGVVTVETESSFGSGAILSSNGYIVTNYHVIGTSDKIYVRLGKEKKVLAEKVRVNKDYDLALLKISGENFKALQLGNSEQSATGDEIYAAGTPLDKTLGQTITRGIISGYRNWNGVNFIQNDVSVNSGNSGGPLLNEQGQIIGITTMKLVGKGIEGISFGIPANVVKEVLNIEFK
jgi:serine protease Do